MFPGCLIFHLDANEIQGIPDILILYENKWAALEGKKHKNASHRPNQDYYVNLMNEMSYASFIYPENKEEVFDELQQALRPRRSTRISKR
jgi:tRNA C32,U32 (ribose-2'-O)-methylase TrmJ